jgi:hypothetical protein
VFLHLDAVVAVQQILLQTTNKDKMMKSEATTKTANNVKSNGDSLSAVDFMNSSLTAATGTSSSMFSSPEESVRSLNGTNIESSSSSSFLRRLSSFHTSSKMELSETSLPENNFSGSSNHDKKQKARTNLSSSSSLSFIGQCLTRMPSRKAISRSDSASDKMQRSSSNRLPKTVSEKDLILSNHSKNSQHIPKQQPTRSDSKRLIKIITHDTAGGGKSSSKRLIPVNTTATTSTNSSSRDLGGKVRSYHGDNSVPAALASVDTTIQSVNELISTTENNSSELSTDKVAASNVGDTNQELDFNDIIRDSPVQQQQKKSNNDSFGFLLDMYDSIVEDDSIA